MENALEKWAPRMEFLDLKDFGVAAMRMTAPIRGAPWGGDKYRRNNGFAGWRAMPESTTIARLIEGAGVARPYAGTGLSKINSPK